MAKEKKKDSKKNNKDSKAVVVRRTSLQEMLPIKDISNGCFIGTGGRYFPVIELGSINFDLMSPEEKSKLHHALTSTLSGLRFTSFHLMIVPMPFDIDSWINEYYEKRLYWKNTEDSLRDEYNRLTSDGNNKAFGVSDEIYYARRMQEFISNLIDFNIKNVVEGAMTTKKSFFIPILTQNTDVKLVLEQAVNVKNSLKSIGVDAQVCSDLELRTLLQVLLNPKNSELIKPSVAKTLPVRNEYLYGNNGGTK